MTPILNAHSGQNEVCRHAYRTIGFLVTTQKIMVVVFPRNGWGVTFITDNLWLLSDFLSVHSS